MKEGMSEFDAFLAEIKDLGGWEVHYKKSQHEELLHLQQQLNSGELSADSIPSKETVEYKIRNIEALFAVHELLEKSGHPTSFIGLTHTLHNGYAATVIRPMRALLEAGKTEEAFQLYKQPRRHYR